MAEATLRLPEAQPATLLGILAGELKPTPGREKRVLKIVVTVVLVVVISMALQIPEAAVSAYMVFFTMKEDRISTLIGGMLMILGLTIGIAASLLLYQLTADDPGLRVPAMTLALFLGMFFSRVFAIGPIAFALGFIISATQSLGDLYPSPEDVVRSMLWLWVALAYPIALSVLVNQVLYPVEPASLLAAGLARRLDGVGACLRRLAALRRDSLAAEAFLNQAASGPLQELKLLGISGIQHGEFKKRHPAIESLIFQVDRMVTEAASLELDGNSSLSDAEQAVLRDLASECDTLGQSILNKTVPERRPPGFKDDGGYERHPQLRALMEAAGSVRSILCGEFHAPPEPAKKTKIRKRLLVPDAFSNHDHIRFALKVTMAAMFCYVVYTALDWSGIHTAFITCCFIALESTDATVHKGTLRVTGCLVGGLLGFLTILYIVPRAESIVSLALLIAAGSTIAAWVATGSERISYAGLQIALAFYLSTLQGFSPGTNLDPIRDRVVGILFGILVMTFVFNHVWPERASDRLRQILAGFFDCLARLSGMLASGHSDRTEVRNLQLDFYKKNSEWTQISEYLAFEFIGPGSIPRRLRSQWESLASAARGAFITGLGSINDVPGVQAGLASQEFAAASGTIRGGAPGAFEDAQKACRTGIQFLKTGHE